MATKVLIRALDADDYDAVIRLASELNATERYLRFFTRYPPYIGEWALSLTSPSDGVVAIGAFESGELTGVANYAELPKAGYAEIAVLVAHEQHQRGIGTALLKALGLRARRDGLHHLVADVLIENTAMRQVIRDVAWAVDERRDGDVLRLDVDLDKSEGP